MRRPLRQVLGCVIGAAFLNYCFANLYGDVGYNIGRVAIALVGGWLVVASTGSNLWVAAMIGPLMLLIDHLILKGGYFLFFHFFSAGTEDGKYLMSAGGVLISFFMFLPVAGIVSFLGGLFARWKGRNVHANP